MVSMTDFIDSINVSDSLNVYTEDYSWAEEYAEYYNEDSSNYLQPILESSGYQFFGEATFYQEAHKGLIAGGILALVSGAFFMITKLLNGGGGSGGSGGAGSKDPMADFNKRNRERETELNKARENARVMLNRAYGHGTNSNENNKPSNSPKPSSAHTTSTVQLPKKDSTTTGPAGDKTKKAELPELEDENNVDYSGIDMVISDLEKEVKNISKTRTDNIILHKSWNSLREINKALNTLHSLCDRMCRFIKDDEWWVFGSSMSDKSKLAQEYHDTVDNLDSTVKEIKSTIKNMKNISKQSDEDYNDSDYKSFDLRNIKDQVKDIRRTMLSVENICKEGMKICKVRRQAYENKPEDETVANIDKAYKTLNRVVKDVNDICQSLTAVLKTYKNGAGDKIRTYYVEIDNIPDRIKYLSCEGSGIPSERIENAGRMLDMHANLYRSNEKWPPRLFNYIFSGLFSAIRMLSGYTNEGFRYSDRRVKEINTTLKEKTIKELEEKQKKTISGFSKISWLKESGIIDKIIDIYSEGFDLIKTLCTNDINPSNEFTQTNLMKEGGYPPAKKFIDKYNIKFSDYGMVESFDTHSLTDTTNKSERKKSDNGSSVDAYVENMPATSFNAFFDTLKREEDDIRKTLYIPAAPHSIQFYKQLQKEFAKYEDDKDQEDFAINVHSILEKYVYGSDTYMSNSEWQRIERMLDRIGYKSIEAKVGDNISLSKTYWTRPIKAKNPGDKESNTIKQIQQMPRVMKINIDGDDVVMKLAGKCTYWE